MPRPHNSPASHKPDSAPSVDAKLKSWLKRQADKLKSLKSAGHRFKLDFLDNCREQGKTLSAVKERLAATTLTFKEWVQGETDIGYSTALLWIDVAMNYEVVKKQFLNSNPLEFSVRQARDAIRDARQAEGKGKPGSGKKQATTATETATHDDPDADDGDSTEDSVSETDAESASSTVAWKKTVERAEAEAATTKSGEKPPAPPLYKVAVHVFSADDQQAVQKALSGWSPLCRDVTGASQLRSVEIHAQPGAIGNVMQKLGNALEGIQSQKVRVQIEL